MREFDTAVRVATEDKSAQDEGKTFNINERDEEGNLIRTVQCRYFDPTEGQVAMTMAAMGRHTNNNTKLAGIIDFMIGVLDEPSHHYIVDRLMDRKDPFGLEDVEGIMMEMIEEWTGRPTQPPSGSTSSQRPGGRNSTPSTSLSTSSASVPTAS